MARHFKIEAFPHSLNQTNPRYGEFVERASIREVLGLELPVASIDDVLQARVWD